MIAIASLLDDIYSEKVTELTNQLELRFGLKEVKMTPYPHLTLLTAEIPDMEELKDYLELICLETPVFNIRTTGLGIFPGENPVIYIPVLRTPPLNQLHSRLHKEVAEMSSEMGLNYNQNMWLPHITLALGDTSQELLGDVLSFLNNFRFNWKIKIDNLTILRRCGDFYLKEDEFKFRKPELIS
jgi:2'-5' RNA ligase